MKRFALFVAFTLAMAVLAISMQFISPVSAQESQVDVYENQQLVKSVVFVVGMNEYYVNNQVPGIKMDVEPFIEQGRTFVPVRFLGNALGVDDDNITWDGQTQKATLVRGQYSAELVIGKKQIVASGQAVATDVAPQLRTGRTFLPARFVAEALGYEVDWDPQNNIVLCWPKGIEKPDIKPVLEYLDEEAQDTPANVVDITGKGQPAPEALLQYKTPGWMINYITVDDLKKRDYQIADIRVIDLRVDKDYVWVKQEQVNRSPIHVVLYEDGNVYRSRAAYKLHGSGQVFEAQYLVVNDLSDKYANWPTAKIEDARYIFLENARTILAVENPLYKGGN